MKSKKIMAILGLTFISACAAVFLLLGGLTERQQGFARLPLPELSTCSNLEHPLLPKRFRAVYLMAPFTTGQLVIGEILHDSTLSATRLTLYGVEQGLADFLVMGETTYLLPSAEIGGKTCSVLGDTGWRPLPADWLSKTSRCVGAAPVLKTPTNWWSTGIDPSPSSYWIWSKHSDATPLRLVFPHPTDRLAALSRFAMSHQLAFETLKRTDLADIATSCQKATRKNLARRPTHPAEIIDAMAHSQVRADAAIARLIPGLNYRCAAPVKPLWPQRLALTGLLTPFDSDMDPMPMEVLYDWNLHGQRSRVFPRTGEFVAHDFLLLKSGGYNVFYENDGAITCASGLPGALRPDWSQRAPCKCRAQIDVGTALTPDEPLRIFSCPLNMPRIAWAWYASSGVPAVFMVTSILGDEGSADFAVLDYHQWAPHLPSSPSAFTKPAQCPDSPQVSPGMPTAAVTNCVTCHSSMSSP